MNTRKKIEVFSAGCSTCKETIELVKKVAGRSHEVVNDYGWYAFDTVLLGFGSY